MRSRLDRYVLYYHRGFREDMGFTASFKPLLIRFTQLKYAATVKEGWYMVKKKPTRVKLLVTPDDLEPLGRGDLLKFVARMRMRFYKLVNSDVKSLRLAVVKPEDIPLADIVALLKLRESGELEFAKVSAFHAYAEIRRFKRVIVSRNGDLVLIVVAL